MYDIESILDIEIKSFEIGYYPKDRKFISGSGGKNSDWQSKTTTQILHLLLFLLFPPAPFIMLRGKARERSGIQVTTNWEWGSSRQNSGIQGAFLSSTSSTGWIMTWIRMISVQFTVKFCFTIADALNTWCFIFLTVFLFDPPKFTIPLPCLHWWILFSREGSWETAAL